MQKLKVFNNNEFGEIRTLEVDSQIWFVGNDVAKALGYKKPGNAVTTKVQKDDTLKQGVIDNIGRTQTTTLINESGLYSLIFGSDLEKSQQFKHWVTSEVLPSIRKHGAYMTPVTLEQTIQDPNFLIGLLENLKQEQLKSKNLEQQIEQDKSKVVFAEAVATSKGAILIRQLAKLLNQNGYDIGEKRLFEQLRCEGYLIKREGSDYNTPTQKAMDLGLFRVKETAITRTEGVKISFTTKVTGVGQQYFIDKYASNQVVLKND